MVELKSISTLLIMILIFLAVGGAFSILLLKYSGFEENKKSCFVDDDCVSAQCCHPTDVVNKIYRPDCSGIVCTAVCEGPIDCGKGKLACVNEKCVIISLE